MRSSSKYSERNKYDRNEYPKPWLNGTKQTSRNSKLSSPLNTTKPRMQNVQDRLYTEFKNLVLKEAQKQGRERYRVKSRLNAVRSVLYP
mmetsp:Transcript_21112/g.24336  ORF Transcript_21112/g.24336 Transcript_21112/m.24336 type:complete len:89 (-) Transcript_21112:9-275(-)